MVQQISKARVLYAIKTTQTNKTINITYKIQIVKQEDECACVDWM